MALWHQEIKIVSALFLLPLLAMSTARPIKQEDNENCWYELFVLTGELIGAGTDSEVNVTLCDNGGHEVEIRDLKQYGIYGPDYPYFQKGQLDLFGVPNRTCLNTDPCRIILHIDAVGIDHDWYCKSIYAAGLINDTVVQHGFAINQWLTPEQPEHIIDDCTGFRDGNAHGHGHGHSHSHGHAFFPSHSHTHGHAFFQSILRR